MAKPIKPIPVLSGEAARKFLDSVDKNFKRHLSGAEKAKRRRQNIRMKNNLKKILAKSK
jgi:hypothetical protein